MRGRKTSFTVQLFPREQQDIEHWLRSPTLQQGLARRGRLLLLLHQGQTLTAAAGTVGFTVRNARKWVKRYLAHGLHGLYDQPGRGRKPVFSPLGRPPSGQDGLRAAG